jgi:coniferyl-aldehyde dehydrogenase
MDQVLKAAGQNALDLSDPLDPVRGADPAAALAGLFQRMVELSRAAPAPTLAERLDRLARLRAAVAENEGRFERAISADFGHRCATETLIAETLLVLDEIRHARAHLKAWMRPRRVATQPQFWPASNRLMPQPLGVVGIIAPWNYPLQLTLAPAVGALSAGNRVLIKPSERVPRFSALLAEVIAAKFDADEMAVTGIGDGLAKTFAALPFDHLIFTGSTRVGRLVAEAAGRNMTPVTLELGGKSPAIVDRSADLAQAAERIAYAKLLNAGQTCIAPDYALVTADAVAAVGDAVFASLKRMMGTAAANPDYSSIIPTGMMRGSRRWWRTPPRKAADPAAGARGRSGVEIDPEISPHRDRRRDTSHGGGLS